MIIKWTLEGGAKEIWQKLKGSVDLPDELLLQIALQLLAAYFEQSSQGREFLIRDNKSGKIIGKLKKPAGSFEGAIEIWNAPKP